MDIVTRVKNMVLAPSAEWPVIASEPDNVQALYRGYIAPLAAIPAVAGLIGSGLLYPHISFGTVLLAVIVLYVLNLIGVYVMAWIAAKLAPMFGGTDNIDRGLKLIAYGATASWVGGVFRIIPVLSIISLLCSIYSLYVIYTGITPMMSVTGNRAIGYIVALIVALVVVAVVIGLLASGVVGGRGMM